VNVDLVAWLVIVVIVAWFFLVMPWLLRRRAIAQARRLQYMLAAVTIMADAHRQTCRALIGRGEHGQCPVCHVDEALWEEVILPVHRSMHIVSLAKHHSWLDPDVEIARIVTDKFHETEGGTRP
jgi:pimeloyl-ACP methyl ester carboxylesterase